ncbi:hypothetical protein ILUMI_09703 [Ignelater luminosus]|uniref:Uncharacterized protein n=1 Tax=Ignelater luminosus TaxID=2038154 RepID=A0A8K0GC62_IGNLU|nr:hypothetical protein ILUMI_09703 [Ignelater luminosus]
MTQKWEMKKPLTIKELEAIVEDIQNGDDIDAISYLVLFLIHSEAKNAFEVAVEEEKSDTEQPRTTTSWSCPSRDSLSKEVRYDEIGHNILRQEDVLTKPKQRIRLANLSLEKEQYEPLETEEDFKKILEGISLLPEQNTKESLISKPTWHICENYRVLQACRKCNLKVHARCGSEIKNGVTYRTNAIKDQRENAKIGLEEQAARVKSLNFMSRKAIMAVLLKVLFSKIWHSNEDILGQERDKWKAEEHQSTRAEIFIKDGGIIIHKRRSESFLMQISIDEEQNGTPELEQSHIKDPLAQGKDDHIQALNKILATEPYENYLIKHNILHKYEDLRELIVVPRLMQNAIIRKAYDNGHFATRKTEEVVKREQRSRKQKLLEGLILPDQLRAASRNTLKKLSGAFGEAKDAGVVDAWKLLSDDLRINTIVTYTNQCITEIKGKFTKERYARKTDDTEINLLGQQLETALKNIILL